MSFFTPKSKSEEMAQRLPIFLDDEDRKCSIENCEAHCFRGTEFCRFHHQEKVAKMMEEREAESEAGIKAMQHKDFPKRQKERWLESRNRHCSHCGKFGLHKAVPKPKDQMPKNPTCYEETLRILCQDCLKAGR